MRRLAKLVGLAGLAGAAIAGVVATRRRSSEGESSGHELHARLHRRPGDVASNGDQAARTSTRR